jgi:autophagy-related protein 18
MIRRTSQHIGLSLATKVGEYLPSSVTEMWEPQRHFAWVNIPRARAGSIASAAGQAQHVVSGIAAAAGAAASAATSGAGQNPGQQQTSGIAPPVKSVVAMSSGHPQVLVVTSDGQFLVFNLDLERGGEGVLERKKSVLRRRRSLSGPIDES